MNTYFKVELWARSAPMVETVKAVSKPADSPAIRYFDVLEEAEKARRDHQNYIWQIEYEESCERGHV